MSGEKLGEHSLNVAIPYPTFHALDEVRPPLAFSPDLFRSVVRWLPDQGFEAIGVTQASRRLRRGAHTLMHPDVRKLSTGASEEEVGGSRSALAAMLGVNVPSFAYPFGAWSEKTREIVSRHFECACTTRLRQARAADAPRTLPRIEAHYLRAGGTFRLLASPALPSCLTARNIARSMLRQVQAVRFP